MEPGSGEPGDITDHSRLTGALACSQWSRVLENPVTANEALPGAKKLTFSMEPGSGEPGDQEVLAVALEIFKLILNGAGFWRTR